jgi:hypothetical protein
LAPTASKPESTWKVRFNDEFEEDFNKLSKTEQDDLLAAAKALQTAGPQTGRPHVDTLNGSKHENMKELRYKSEDGTQVWRAAFAFDPNRQAVVLCAADKQGVPKKVFYKGLVEKADERFDAELKRIKDGRRRSEEQRKAAEKEAAREAKSTNKGKRK